MLRRLAGAGAPRHGLAVSTVCASIGNTMQLSAWRWASTTADASAPPAAAAMAASDAALSRRRMQQNGNMARQQRTRRETMPPAFDIVHWNDEDISAGHLLRVLHRDGFVVLDYHRQRHPSVQTREDGSRVPNANRAEKVVTVTLPPVYVARFLSVLEGRTERMEVQSRFTNASFAPLPAKGKHHYVLHCTSMRPTTGQIQTIDGTDLQEETVEWTVELDAAESLMLHRFLTQSLHYNNGFSA